MASLWKSVLKIHYKMKMETIVNGVECVAIYDVDTWGNPTIIRSGRFKRHPFMETCDCLL